MVMGNLFPSKTMEGNCAIYLMMLHGQFRKRGTDTLIYLTTKHRKRENEFHLLESLYGDSLNTMPAWMDTAFGDHGLRKRAVAKGDQTYLPVGPAYYSTGTKSDTEF